MSARGALRRAIGSVVVALVVVATVAGGAAPASAADESSEWAFVDAINRARAEAALPALVPLAGLRDVARAQTVRMIQQSTLYHNPTLARDVTAAVPDWTRAGENVGVGGDVPSLDGAFLASPGHRANILGDYRYVGIGTDRAAD